MNVLVLNSGSSSLKFELIVTDLDRMQHEGDERLFRGMVERIGGEAIITIHLQTGKTHKFTAPVRDTGDALTQVTNWLTSPEAKDSGLTGLSDVHAVGHRIVHGGEMFSESAVINDGVIRGIQQCIDLAPLHNPNNLKGVFAAQQLLGADVPQVAVFDTAFHHTLPQCAYLYAIPYHLYRRYKIRRYGFHGTSHRYVAYRYRMLRKLSREETNVITLHLGNGCSAAAISKGCSIDTSMGLTPLEGLVMGSRSGDIDASIVDFVARNENLSTHQVEGILNTQSGLLGISGVTNDMRELQGLAVQADDQRAQLAIDMFCYRARKYIGAFLAAMGGADAVVFTGGIGENSPEIRARICDQLAWAGLKIDRTRNDEAKGTTAKISTDDSRLGAYCIPTDEELVIARDTVRAIHGVPHPS